MADTTQQGAQRFSLEVLRDFMTLLSDPSTVFTLHVGDGFNERVVYFCGGGVRLLSVGERQGPDVVDVLLEQGKIDVEALHDVLEKVRGGDSSLKTVLEEKNLVGRDEFDAINSKLIRDAIFDLVFWEDAFYKTYRASPPAEVFSQGRQALTASLDFIGLASDARRWIDRWEKIKGRLRSDVAPIMLTSQGRKALREGSAVDRELLNLCDGGTSLRVLRRLSPQELPEVAESVYEALRQRWISVLRPDEKGRTDADAIVELEEALPRVIDGELAREKLVDLYMRVKNRDKACEHLAVLAREAHERCDAEGSNERWSRVLTLRPTDEEAFKALVEARIDVGREVEVIRLGEEFARALGKEGHQNPRDAVDQLLQRIPRVRSLSPEFQRAWREAKQSLGLEGGERPVPRTQPRRSTAARRVARGPLIGIAALFLLVVFGGSWALWHFGLVRIPDLSELLPFGSKEAESASPEFALPMFPQEEDGEVAVLGGVPVPLEGRRGAMPHEMFRTNEDGTISTPFGTLPAPPQGLPPGFADLDEEEWRELAEQLYLPKENPSFALPPGTDADALPMPEGGGFFGGFGTRPADRDDAPRVSTPPLTRHLQERQKPPKPLPPRPTTSRVPWKINEGLEVSVIEGTLRIVDKTTSEEVLEFPGTASDRWVISPGAELVCRWRPGKHASVHRRITGETVTTTWRIPHGAEALVVSEGYVAVCEGDITAVYHHDGTPVVRRLIPRWREGFFAGNVLVCLPAASQRGHPRARMYLASSLELFWAGRPLGWGG